MPKSNPATSQSRPPEIKSKALYGTLPFDIAFDGRCHDLDPFTLAIALGLTATARRIIRHGAHVQAFETSGRDFINDERRLQEKHQREWRAKKQGKRTDAPMREHVHKEPGYKAGRIHKNLKGAGAYGYKLGAKRLGNQPLPKFIPVVMSRWNILRVAHLSADGKNILRLNEALGRLSAPVAGMPPLLSEIEDQSTGELRLHVCGVWLGKPFMRVPLPLPTRSRPATLLYMFICGLKTRSIDRGDISFKTLCNRIGIEATEGWRARAAFDRAKDVLNNHLGKIDGERLRRETTKLNVPGAIKIVSVNDGDRVRIEGIARQRPFDGEYEIDDPPARAKLPVKPFKQSLPRVRVPPELLIGMLPELTDEENKLLDADFAEEKRQKAMTRKRQQQDHLRAEIRAASLASEIDHA